MFVDASALCAVVALESDGAFLAAKMDGSSRSITSATAVWEAAIDVARIRSKPPAEALASVRELLALMRIEVVAIPPETATIAIDAFARFGKGRHPAALNFSDCFAYACAQHYRVPLLFKGGDFGQTDIQAA